MPIETDGMLFTPRTNMAKLNNKNVQEKNKNDSYTKNKAPHGRNMDMTKKKHCNLSSHKSNRNHNVVVAAQRKNTNDKPQILNFIASV